MAADMGVVAWLRMMERFSPLMDSKPHFARIADELEQLRAENAALRSPPPLRPAALAA